MCLYPKKILNPKYKKNPQACWDYRLRVIEIPCGVCQECRKKRASEWRARITAEMKKNINSQFVTLTISDEYIEKVENQEIHQACADLMRKLTKNANKQKVKMKRVFISEIGGNDTQRLHFHGIVWPAIDKETWKKLWPYGIVDTGYKCDQSTVSYITKYMLKGSEKFPDYISRVYSSGGIGADYVKSTDAKKRNQYRGKDTNQKLKTESGKEIELPMYWKKKLYTDYQRELLRIDSIEKQEKWVNGNRIDMTDPDWYKEYRAALDYQRERAKEAGFQKPQKNQKKIWRMKNNSYICETKQPKIKNYVRNLYQAKNKNDNRICRNLQRRNEFYGRRLSALPKGKNILSRGRKGYNHRYESVIYIDGPFITRITTKNLVHVINELIKNQTYITSIQIKKIKWKSLKNN